MVFFPRSSGKDKSTPFSSSVSQFSRSKSSFKILGEVLQKTGGNCTIAKSSCNMFSPLVALPTGSESYSTHKEVKRLHGIKD